MATKYLKPGDPGAFQDMVVKESRTCYIKDLEKLVSDEDLMEAIRLRISECFPAMNIANALGGAEDIPWKLVRQCTLVQMVVEALDRNLPVKDLRAVDGKPFLETSAYLVIRDKIAELGIGFQGGN
jgi:hypothetical protein